jgi:phosphoadenosine phosphosulfate reductase
MGAIDLHARPSKDFEEKLAETQALLIRAAAEFSPLTQASSLGAEDVVITHLINQLELDIPVFVLDTGMLHQETLELLERTEATSRAPVTIYRPLNEAVITFVAREGKEPMYRSIALRKACCHIRKVEPLERALAGQKAWITGLRREQSNARAEVPLVDTTDPRAKFNPLASWTWGDVWHYIGANAVDYNPLHDQFFPSIGCAPCTRAISLGEDFRAGRWWWEDENAKECGLHVKEAVIPARRDPSASGPVASQPTYGLRVEPAMTTK